MNFALTDGDTVVCSRFCDKYPAVAPPSLYFCYGDAHQLQKELCAPETEDPAAHGKLDDISSDLSDSEHGVIDAFEKDLSQQLSLPGKLLSQVDPASSGFIVSSDPLTKTNNKLVT